MKLFTNLRNRMRKNIIKGQGGQGATEYILLLVVIVGVVMVFGPKIKSAIEKKTVALEGDMDKINNGP